MSILVDERSKVIVQGITGHQGSFHAQEMLAFGTKVVAGVAPGRGGSKLLGIPVLESVSEAVEETGADTSIVFVPAKNARDAVIEAIESDLRLVAIVSEHIPEHDAIELIQYAKLRGTTIIGPNCPGVTSPGKSKVGIMPNSIFKPGKIGVVSRSGTLTYEIVSALTQAGLGQSTCLGIGGDPVVGTSFVDALAMLELDPQTEAIVLVGEIGGSAEEEAASFITSYVSKPVFAYIAGRTAPPGKKMGHAGAIISRGRGSAQSKMAALSQAGALIADLPHAIPKLVASRLLKED